MSILDSRTSGATGLIAAPYLAGMRIATGEDPAQVMQGAAAEVTLGVTGAHALRHQMQRTLGPATGKSLLDTLSQT